MFDVVLLMVNFVYLVLFDVPIAFLIALFKRNIIPDFSNDIVLITGAAQGIGKELAIQFAEHSGTLVLWDIQEAKLKDTCLELKSQGHKVYYYIVDVSSKESVYKAANQVKEEVGDITVLVNNAGITQCKTIMEYNDEDIQLITNVNYLSHFWMIRSFLPSMLKKNYGYIVGIASAAAFNGNPYISSYCASKAAVLSLHESLTAELFVAKKDGISVTCACPGFVETASFGMRNKFLDESIKGLPVLSPEKAARLIFTSAVQRKETIVFPMYISILVAIKYVFSEKVKQLILRFSWKKGMKTMVQHHVNGTVKSNNVY